MPEQPGGAADADDEHTGGHRVEGSGVTDAPRAGEPAYPPDDVMRGPAGRLVDDDQSIGGAKSMGDAGPVGHGRGASASAARKAIAVASTPSRDVNPAASLCPPPPR